MDGKYYIIVVSNCSKIIRIVFVTEAWPGIGIVPQPILLISFHYLNRNETHVTSLSIAFNIRNIIFVSIVACDVSMPKKE